MSQNTKLLNDSYYAKIKTIAYTLIVIYNRIMSNVDSPSYIGYGYITATRSMPTIMYINNKNTLYSIFSRTVYVIFPTL